MNKTKDLTIRLLQKQIEVYQEIQHCLELSKDVLKKFDGKVINVKIDRALKEINTKNSICASNDIINIYIYDRYVKTDLTCEYSSVTYVDYSNWTISLQIDKETDKRLDYKATSEYIDENIQMLNERILTIEQSIKDYDNMIADYESIKKQIGEFNKKYNSCIRDGLRFRVW